MAYKKYIQRNGKLYGPYIYESKRVNGKVVSEYHGSKGPKKLIGLNGKNHKKIFAVFIGILLVIVLIYFLAFHDVNRLTGKVVFGIDASYSQGEPLDGVLKFSLKEGELLPSFSMVVFENSGKSYDFILGEVLDETFSEGDYYLEEKEIEGRGLGYGLEGERVVYPEIKFVLQVYKESDEETETSEEIQEETTEENVTKTEASEEPETLGELSEETTEQENSAPITGETVKGSGGFFTSFFGLTGMVSMNLEQEIEGVVSKDKPFVYDLKSGEIIELKPRSVRVNGEELDDDTVSLNVEDNKVTVTTDYSIVEKGYGKEYLGDKEKSFSLDLSDLNLVMEEGDLNIKLIYDGEEILSLKTTLEEGEETSEEVVEETGDAEEVVEIPEELEPINETSAGENETVEDIIDSSLWDISDFLTEEERKVLIEEFGGIELKNTKSELFKGRIIVDYEFGEYSIEYSYDSSLSKEVLEIQMERDRIKFLKDIANSILKEDTSSEVFTGFNETYAP